MYYVHWVSYCCDIGSFRGVDECDSLPMALAYYVMHNDPAGSDGPCGAGILRADGSQVRPPHMLGPIPMPERVARLQRAIEAGDFASMAEHAQYLLDLAGVANEVNSNAELRFEAMAKRASVRWWAASDRCVGA